jgi:S-adenosylmethionine:diacylglycerol 3-amino-3-carboxypropyl transferase
MRFLYDFGISQDDPHVEASALALENNTVLCIASGGEVPLSLLAKYNTHIKALDISLNQIRLCRLKLASVLLLEPQEAAVFLGFKKDYENNWRKYYERVLSGLSDEDIQFWNLHEQKLTRGPINYSRFEKYLSFFCRLIRQVIGKSKLIKFCELVDIENQQIFFDTYIHKQFIYWFFKIAFSPQLYKNRGLDKQALIHQHGNHMASFFYRKFRDFFTATPARYNGYLQFYFLGEVVFYEAMPDYLLPKYSTNIHAHKHNIEFEVKSILDEIIEAPQLSYGNYAVSNISDWVETEKMNELLVNMSKKTIVPYNILFRYIHKNPINNIKSQSDLVIDEHFSKKVHAIDRFPFYSFVKGNFTLPQFP